MLECKLFTQEEIDAIDKKTTTVIDEAVTFGLNSPEPSLDSIMTDIYA